jgi:hypothetical protein
MLVLSARIAMEKIRNHVRDLKFYSDSQVETPVTHNRRKVLPSAETQTRSVTKYSCHAAAKATLTLTGTLANAEQGRHLSTWKDVVLQLTDRKRIADGEGVCPCGIQFLPGKAPSATQSKVTQQPENDF